MQGLASGIDSVLNGNAKGEAKKYGFVLLVAEFGNTEGGQVNWVSNGERESMLTMTREYLARAEGRYHETEKGLFG
jgi:hypothetical protein